MKNMKIYLNLLTYILITSCSSESVGEFASGVSNGVVKAINPKIEISESLKKTEITFGKMTVSSDSIGNDNLLQIYIIFNSDLKKEITAKAFDSKKLEIGRVKIKIEGKKDEAKYFVFHYNNSKNKNFIIQLLNNSIGILSVIYRTTHAKKSIFKIDII